MEHPSAGNIAKREIFMGNAPFSFDSYLFPIFAVMQGQSEVKVKRFLGSGFWLDGKGHFLTCRHVLEGLAEGQLPAIGQPFGNRRDHFIPILSSTAHAKYDAAVGVAPATAVKGVLARYSGPLGVGLDVQAFGFTDAGKEQGSYQLDVRLLRGHVSRFSEDALGLPSPSLVEVSFGSPSGFSGTPLLVNKEVVGMMYRNVETKIEAYSVNETTEGSSQYKEVAYRIYEYGVAHSLEALSGFLSDCGVDQ